MGRAGRQVLSVRPGSGGRSTDSFSALPVCWALGSLEAGVTGWAWADGAARAPDMQKHHLSQVPCSWAG